MSINFLHNKQISLVVLRGISILAKFLFTILFFKTSETEFGEYSLIATTIILLVFVLGLDFYSYANRAVLELKSKSQKIIFNQFVLYIFLYIALLPIIYFIFLLLNFKSNYFWYFYFVLITEHLNTEYYRLLFVVKKPLLANLNLFIRNGLWVLIVVVYLYLYNRINLLLILKLWLLGNLLALFYTSFFIYKKIYKINIKYLKLDIDWIKKGIYFSTPYIFSTIAYKTIEFSDRYMIDYFMDKKSVGIYSFFANMANVINIILFTAVISVLYPNLVETIMEKKLNKFKQIYKKFQHEIIYYGITISIILSISLPIILLWIDKQVYLQQFYIFITLILANIFLNISFLYHFIIYAYKKDWKIFQATFIAALINVLLNLILIPIGGIFGASLSTLISYLFIWFTKKYWSKKLLLK